MTKCSRLYKVLFLLFVALAVGCNTQDPAPSGTGGNTNTGSGTGNNNGSNTGSGIVEVTVHHIYDNTYNLDSLVHGAQVTLYTSAADRVNQENNFKMGYTDSTGKYISENLPISTYYLEIKFDTLNPSWEEVTLSEFAVKEFVQAYLY